MTFSELLEQAKTSKVRAYKDIPVVLNKQKVVLRVYEIPSYDWAGLTTKHPPRDDSASDKALGYNLTAAGIDAAGMGAFVLDGEEETRVTAEQWDTLLEVLHGVELGNLADAAFALNDWLPRNRVAAAKKASAGDSKKSSSSPANSESPSEG